MTDLEMAREIAHKNKNGFMLTIPKHCVSSNYAIKFRKFGYRLRPSRVINPFRLGFDNPFVKTHFNLPFIYCFSSLMSLLTLQFYYLHNIMQRTVIMIYFPSEIVFNLLSSLCHISLKLITPCTIYSFISSSFDQPLFCCASFRLSSSKSHFCLKLVAGVNFKCGAEVLKKNPR